MAQFPAFPLWTDAYLGDTGHLTTLEHGAYFLLLVTMWRNKGSLPNDDSKLCRYARMTKGQWLRIRPTIIEFFDVENGLITQGRLTDEYDAVRQLSKRQSRKAKARWLKEKKTVDAMASPRQCPADASPTPTPIDTLPNGKDADGVLPSKNVDPKKVVYDQGKSLLRAYGIANGTAGGLITKWLRAHDPPDVIEAIMTAGQQERHNIVEFITGTLRNGIPPETESNGSEERVARALEILRQRDQ